MDPENKVDTIKHNSTTPKMLFKCLSLASLELLSAFPPPLPLPFTDTATSTLFYSGWFILDFSGHFLFYPFLFYCVHTIVNLFFSLPSYRTLKDTSPIMHYFVCSWCGHVNPQQRNLYLQAFMVNLYSVNIGHLCSNGKNWGICPSCLSSEIHLLVHTWFYASGLCRHTWQVWAV